MSNCFRGGKMVDASDHLATVHGVVFDIFVWGRGWSACRTSGRGTGPPSPCGLRRGSLHSLRFEFVALARLAEARDASEGWWARQDSNLQPDRYERPALTIELQAPPRAAETAAGNGAGIVYRADRRSGNPGLNRPKRRRIPPPCAISRSRRRPVCRIRPGSSASAGRRPRRAAPPAWGPSALRRSPC